MATLSTLFPGSASFLAPGQNLSDLSNAATARSNLGVGGNFKGENGERNSGGAGDIFRVHEQTLNTNVTIDADENALCCGPLTVASGVTVTVTSGGILKIV